MPSCKTGRKPDYLPGPFGPFIQEFVTYLGDAGVGPSQRGKLWRVAEDVLTWLQRDGTAIDSVDDAVLRRFRDECCEEFLKGREPHRPFSDSCDAVHELRALARSIRRAQG